MVIVDTSQRILLAQYREMKSGQTRSYWVPPGGALEQGESHRDAACRELREETGLIAEIGDESGTITIPLESTCGLGIQIERYFLVCLNCNTPDVRNDSTESIVQLRWWTFKELQQTSETIYPEGFVDDLPEILLRQRRQSN